MHYQFAFTLNVVSIFINNLLLLKIVVLCISLRSVISHLFTLNYRSIIPYRSQQSVVVTERKHRRQFMTVLFELTIVQVQ